METALHGLPALLNLAGWALYTRGQWAGYIKSNPVGWLMSFIIVLSGGIGLVTQTGSLAAGLMYLLGALPCAAAFMLSLRHGFNPTRNERWLLVLALLLFGLAQYWQAAALMLTAAYYLVTYWTMASSLVAGRTTETLLPWVVWVLAAIAQLVLVSSITPDGVALLLPATNLLCWGVIVAILARAKLGTMSAPRP